MRSRKTPIPPSHSAGLPGQPPFCILSDARAGRPHDSRQDAGATVTLVPQPPAAHATSILLNRNARRAAHRHRPNRYSRLRLRPLCRSFRHLGGLPALLVHVGLDDLGRQACRQFAVLAAFEQGHDNNLRIAPGRESHKPAVLIESWRCSRAAPAPSATPPEPTPVLPAISTPGTCAEGAVPSGSSTRAIASVIRLNPLGSIGIFLTSM